MSSYPEVRLAKIQHVNRQEGYKMIYQWVKTGVINFEEFYSLLNNVSAI
jgi:hypothetical protein